MLEYLFIKFVFLPQRKVKLVFSHVQGNTYLQFYVSEVL